MVEKILKNKSCCSGENAPKRMTRQKSSLSDLPLWTLMGSEKKTSMRR